MLPGTAFYRLSNCKKTFLFWILGAIPTFLNTQVITPGQYRSNKQTSIGLCTNLPRWLVASRGSAEGLRDGFKGGVSPFQQRAATARKYPRPISVYQWILSLRGGRPIAVGDGAKPMGPTRGESRGRESLGIFSVCQLSSPSRSPNIARSLFPSRRSWTRGVVLLLSWGATRPSHL